MNENVLANRDSSTMEAVLYRVFNEVRAAERAYKPYVDGTKSTLEPEHNNAAARMYIAVGMFRGFLQDNGYLYREVRALGTTFVCAVHPMYIAPFMRGELNLVDGWVSDRPDIPAWAVIPIN